MAGRLLWITYRPRPVKVASRVAESAKPALDTRSAATLGPRRPASTILTMFYTASDIRASSVCRYLDDVIRRVILSTMPSLGSLEERLHVQNKFLAVLKTAATQRERRSSLIPAPGDGRRRREPEWVTFERQVMV